MATVNVDQVAGYALATQPMTLNVDQVVAYALVSQSVNKYLIDAKQHVTNSINKIHNLTLKLTDYDLGVPAVVAGASYNSKINISMKPASGYSGNLDMAYPRAPISDMIVSRDIDTFRWDKVATTTHQMLAVFNTLFGTKLTTQDILNEALPQDATTKFKAADTSVFFIPGTQVDMGYLCPSARDWELPGLAWPEMYNAMINGIDFSPNRTAWNQLPNTLAQLGTSWADLLCNQANALGGLTFWKPGQTYLVLGGLQYANAIRVTLPNAAYPDCDQTGRFTQAIVVPAMASGWWVKSLCFHFNP